MCVFFRGKKKGSAKIAGRGKPDVSPQVQALKMVCGRPVQGQGLALAHLLLDGGSISRAGSGFGGAVWEEAQPEVRGQDVDGAPGGRQGKKDEDQEEEEGRKENVNITHGDS